METRRTYRRRINFKIDHYGSILSNNVFVDTDNSLREGGFDTVDRVFDV